MGNSAESLRDSLHNAVHKFGLCVHSTLSSFFLALWKITRDALEKELKLCLLSLWEVVQQFSCVHSRGWGGPIPEQAASMIQQCLVFVWHLPFSPLRIGAAARSGQQQLRSVLNNLTAHR